MSVKPHKVLSFISGSVIGELADSSNGSHMPSYISSDGKSTARLPHHTHPYTHIIIHTDTAHQCIRDPQVPYSLLHLRERHRNA